MLAYFMKQYLPFPWSKFSNNMCVKTLLIRWFPRKLFWDILQSNNRWQNVFDLMLHRKLSSIAKFFQLCVWQDAVDLFIHLKIIGRYPWSLYIYVSKSCWFVDSPKNFCKAKFFSPDVCQNLVDLLIRQKYPCSLHICVEILLIHWFAKNFFARPSFFHQMCVKILLICWFAKNILAVYI